MSRTVAILIPGSSSRALVAPNNWDGEGESRAFTNFNFQDFDRSEGVGFTAAEIGHLLKERWQVCSGRIRKGPWMRLRVVDQCT